VQRINLPSVPHQFYLYHTRQTSDFLARSTCRKKNKTLWLRFDRTKLKFSKRPPFSLPHSSLRISKSPTKVSTPHCGASVRKLISCTTTLSLFPPLAPSQHRASNISITRYVIRDYLPYITLSTTLFRFLPISTFLTTQINRVPNDFPTANVHHLQHGQRSIRHNGRAEAKATPKTQVTKATLRSSCSGFPSQSAVFFWRTLLNSPSRTLSVERHDFCVRRSHFTVCSSSSHPCFRTNSIDSYPSNLNALPTQPRIAPLLPKISFHNLRLFRFDYPVQLPNPF